MLPAVPVHPVQPRSGSATQPQQGLLQQQPPVVAPPPTERPAGRPMFVQQGTGDTTVCRPPEVLHSAADSDVPGWAPYLLPCATSIVNACSSEAPTWLQAACILQGRPALLMGRALSKSPLPLDSSGAHMLSCSSDMSAPPPSAAVHAFDVWPHPRRTGAPVGPMRLQMEAKLPSQAGPQDLIRLPGQTRVSPEEYKEFLQLGHGNIFELDPDRSVSWDCRGMIMPFSQISKGS